MSISRFCVAVLSFAAVYAACAGDETSNMEVSGIHHAEVPEGATWTYSGVISGDGSIQKYGKGTLVLSGRNAFSGGVNLTNGTLVVAEEGALGTGKLTIGNYSKTPTVSAKFSKPDATVGNPIALPDGSSNASVGTPHVQVAENTVFSGSITSYANTFYMGNVNNNRNSIDTAYPTNRITGSLWVYDTRTLAVTTYGVTIFQGPVTAGAVVVGGVNSAVGSLVLDTDNCNIGKFNLFSGSLYCKKPNVLNGAALAIRRNAAQGASHIDLGGFDQTCSTLGIYSTGVDFPESGTGYSIDSPDGPATLTVTGGVANTCCTNYFAINDCIALRLDADPEFTCIFTKRENGTSGDIVVSKGVFSVTGTATFRNVPRIVVAEEGKFLLSSEKTQALASVKKFEVAGEFRSTSSDPFASDGIRLEIAEGAKFDAGCALNVASLSIRGNELYGGTYTHSEYEEIAEGTVIVLPVTKHAVAWVGGGDDGSVGVAGNWSGGTLPDLAGGGLTAVFAESGTGAVVDRLLYLDGIVFSGDTGFALSGRGDACGITLLEAGLSFAAAAENPERVFSVDVPVTATEAQLWEIPTNTTFRLLDGFSAMKEVVKDGDGELVFSGTNSFASSLAISNGITRFCGTITTPGGADGSDYSLDNSVRCYGATKPGSNGTRTGQVFLDNAIIEKPFCTVGPTGSSRSEEYLWTTENSSNVIRGVWMTRDVSWQRLNQPETAITVFEGGVSNLVRTLFSGGTVHIRNKPHVSPGSHIFQISKNTRVIYEAEGGYIGNLNLGDAEIEFRTSYSMSGGSVVNSATACSINLNCTTQRFDKISFVSAPDVVVDGGFGAALEVKGDGESVIEADVTGEVSVVNSGSGTLALKGRCFSSAGDIVAASGRVEIADGASWGNASCVRVSGDGTVAILRSPENLASQAFGKHTEVHLSGDAVISVPDGSVQRVAYLFVDGVRQPVGNYTHAGIADSNIKKHFAQTTGVLRCVGNSGTVISIR